MHKNTYKYCCNAYYFIYSRKNKHYKTMNREISENSIEFNKEDNFICITDFVYIINSYRESKNNPKIRTDHYITSSITQNLINNILRQIDMPEKSIKTISDLKNVGLAYRKGKGPGQKWFVDYRVFISIVMNIDDKIKAHLISYAINSISSTKIIDEILNSISKNYRSISNNRYKTYIAIDRISGLCKIGRAINIKKRLSALRISNINIEMIYTIDDDIESYMHKLLLGFKEDREWFNIDEGIINSIAKKYGFKKYKQ